MSMRTTNLLTFVAMGVGGASLLAACATTAPAELREARDEYRAISDSEVAIYAPIEVDNARIALDRAERSFDDDGASATTIAKADFAAQEARRARTVAERRQQTEREMARMLDAEQKKDRELGAEVGATTTPPRLQAERGDEMMAALRELHGVVEVTETEDGVVLTLPAGTFATGSAGFGPTAHDKLIAVARVLKLAPDRAIRVEGYADSLGEADYNEALSQRRANNVMDWLVAHNIADVRLTAVGRGERDPVATNDTAEGRAMNRRVQLVIGAPGSAPPAIDPGPKAEADSPMAPMAPASPSGDGTRPTPYQ